VDRFGSRCRHIGSLLYVLALAISRNGQVVEGGVAQGPFAPGEPLEKSAAGFMDTSIHRLLS
jgi:hypothetical protein